MQKEILACSNQLKQLDVRIIIQCRLNSSRLPAKALLPIADLPAVKLCALRASNTGIDTVVAISDQPPDDFLLPVLESKNFRIRRGPINNVLGRFAVVTADMPEDGIVVRLTADNMFPDGRFVEELLTGFIQGGFKYLGTSVLGGLPYGMSAEAFTVRVLREADKNAISQYDREHVTPWIKRKYSQDTRPGNTSRDLSHLRCTMDTFEDYLRIKQVFAGVHDLVNVSWQELCERLENLADAPRFRIPYQVVSNEIHSRFTLGTAQLGMNYGAANQTGKPDSEEVGSILEMAVKHGVNSFDTARVYGDSESRLGFYLQPYKERVNIITKLSPLNDLREDMLDTTISQLVDASIFRSCRELRVNTLDTVLLHRPGHLFLSGGIVWKRLEALRDEGVIRKLGVSVYNPKELLFTINNYNVEHVQLPLNLLDWRWREAEVDQVLSQKAGITTHARSIYLQGILPNNKEFWPGFAQNEAREWIHRLQELVYDLERDSIQDLCLAYILGQTWIHSAVIGVESLLQLKHNLDLFLKNPLTTEECEYIESKLSGASERLLNPSLW